MKQQKNKKVRYSKHGGVHNGGRDWNYNSLMHMSPHRSQEVINGEPSQQNESLEVIKSGFQYKCLPKGCLRCQIIVDINENKVIKLRSYFACTSRFSFSWIGAPPLG